MENVFPSGLGLPRYFYTQNFYFPHFQVNKPKAGTVNNDVVIPKHQEIQKNEDQSSKTPEQVRLEQNIRFLQDQHQLMLAGLHGEIEKLKARNRGRNYFVKFS